MGFPDRWQGWMTECIKTAELSILINGSPSKPFKMQKGLRQGDPLSPFLFNLAGEVLNLIIQKATRRGLWEGVAMRNGSWKITHLQYADDTLLFCPVKVEYLLNVRKTLIAFELLSGLKVNFFKSFLYCLNTDSVRVDELARQLCCKVGEIPFTYLGLPVGANGRGKNLWGPCVEKMEKNLASWKGKMLSIGWRLTLIKASLANLPIYFMSLFPMPVGVAEKIVNIQRKFFWGGGDKVAKSMCLVNFEIVQSPKEMGGAECRECPCKKSGSFV